MGCSCGKRRTPTGGNASADNEGTASINGNTAATASARRSTSTPPTGTRPASSAAQGVAAPASRPGQQSFTGATRSFGSALERDAAAVRARRPSRQVP